MKDENVLDNQALITYLSDTLWGIARETLGGGVKWPAIYALNRDQISDPRYIYPGTVLRLPAA